MSISLYPRGWFWLSQRKINEFYDRSVARADAIAAGQTITLPSDVAGDVEALARKGLFARLPYAMYIVLAPALGNVEATYLHCLATVDQAQIACALERYRLAKGAYPERLEVLVPEFIQALPADPISQAAMRYRVTAAGGFEVWSVAMNGVDDSAREEEKKGPRDQPDWVWRR